MPRCLALGEAITAEWAVQSGAVAVAGSMALCEFALSSGIEGRLVQ